MTCLLDHNTIDSCRPLWPAATSALSQWPEWFSPALAPLAFAVALAAFAFLKSRRRRR